MLKLLKQIDPIKALLVIAIVILIVIVVLCMANKEPFEPIPFSDDKMIMVSDSSGNIETLSMDKLNKYFRSIEADITTATTRTALADDSIEALKQELDTFKANAQSGGVDKPTFDAFKSAIEARVNTIMTDLSSKYIQKNVKYPLKLGSNFSTNLTF